LMHIVSTPQFDRFGDNPACHTQINAVPFHGLAAFVIIKVGSPTDQRKFRTRRD